MRVVERVPGKERGPRSGTKSMRKLDLGEDDPRQDQKERDARPDHRPEPVQAEEGCQGQGDPQVEPDERRAPHEHAESDREGELARCRVLAQGCTPEGERALVELLEHGQRRAYPGKFVGPAVAW